MATICPNCKSADTQDQVRTIECLRCGKRTTYEELNKPKG